MELVREVRREEALADQEQPKYDGPERRVQPGIWTPQFVWQMLTWLFAQIIFGASLYLGISNRLTTIEVKMEERQHSTDREMDAEIGARKLLESRIIVLEKSDAKTQAYIQYKSEQPQQK
jgi:hypothetical protein